MDSEQLISTINKINDSGTHGTKSRKKPAPAGRTSKSVTRYSGRRKTGTSVFSKKQTILLTVVCVLIAGALAGFIGYRLWYNSFTDISLAEYTSITLSGYDTHGTAQLDIIGETEYASFFRTVDAKLSAEENLSNGDELSVSYTYDEQAAKDNKLRINAADAVFTVEGLTPQTVINKELVFSGLDVSFEGISPCISMTIANTSTEPVASEVEFTVESDSRVFESGEEIKVSAAIPEEYLNDPAYRVDMGTDDYTETFTAPETDEYLSDPDVITEEMLTQLENAGYDLISKSDAKEYGLRIFQQEAHLKPVFVGNTTTFKWSSPYVISAYFHSVTESGRQIIENHANDVQIVYGVTLSQQDGTSCQAEMVIQFADIVLKQDGTVDLNLDSGRIVSASYRNSNIKSLVDNDGDGSYVTTKLTE